MITTFIILHIRKTSIQMIFSSKFYQRYIWMFFIFIKIIWNILNDFIIRINRCKIYFQMIIFIKTFNQIIHRIKCFILFLRIKVNTNFNINSQFNRIFNIFHYFWKHICVLFIISLYSIILITNCIYCNLNFFNMPQIYRFSCHIFTK